MQAYYGAPVNPYRLLTDGPALLCILDAHQNQRPKPFVSRISKSLAQYLIEVLLLVAKFLNLARGVSCVPLRFGSLRSLKVRCKDAQEEERNFISGSWKSTILWPPKGLAVWQQLEVPLPIILCKKNFHMLEVNGEL
ncbi:hypothetical protein GX50_01049 [[Emmonsia] crescens]|uniref:Uncharacterized protein n=1 Tax=[Emmonsia] crescens TaxID=73230 RepID=A0A2B7ZTE6_9EURO|nr:hypothetical protein GX50_01049 [Emmonsia crescens]